MKTRVLSLDNTASGEEYTDARYLHQKTRVIPKDKIEQFTVKQWPMLDEGDDKFTNALGYSFDYFKKKRQEQELSDKDQLSSVPQAAAEETSEITDDDPESQGAQITAAELDELRKSCEEEGRKSGYEAGFNEGLLKGAEEGKAQGHQEGFDAGFKQGLDEGVKKGLEQGYEEGRSKGLSDGEAIVSEQSERFRHLADALSEPLRELDAEVTYEVVRMAAALFKTLALRELKVDQEFLMRTLNNAVAKLPAGSREITIKLNADDLMLIETAMGRDYIAAQHWILQEDADLNPGDVVAGNGRSEVRALIDERIDNLIRDFLDEAASAVSDAREEVIEGSPSHEEMLARSKNNAEVSDSFAAGDSAGAQSMPDLKTALSDAPQN